MDGKTPTALSFRIGISSPGSANGRKRSKKQAADSLPPSQTSLTWIESELRLGKRVSLLRK